MNHGKHGNYAMPRNRAATPFSWHNHDHVSPRSWYDHGKIMAWQPSFFNPAVFRYKSVGKAICKTKRFVCTFILYLVIRFIALKEFKIVIAALHFALLSEQGPFLLNFRFFFGIFSFFRTLATKNITAPVFCFAFGFKFVTKLRNSFARVITVKSVIKNDFLRNKITFWLVVKCRSVKSFCTTRLVSASVSSCPYPLFLASKCPEKKHPIQISTTSLYTRSCPFAKSRKFFCGILGKD